MNPMSKLPLIDKMMKIIYLPGHLVSQHYPKDFWVSDIFFQKDTPYNTAPKVTTYFCRFQRNWKLSMGYQSPVWFCRFENYWIFSWRQTYLCPWNWSPYSELKIWKKYLHTYFGTDFFLEHWKYEETNCFYRGWSSC